MSDIPIGSPPVPPGRHAAPRGWYPDPTDSSRERYWDGWGWSRNTRGGERAPGHGPQTATHLGGYPQPDPNRGHGSAPSDPAGSGQGHRGPAPYGSSGPYGSPGSWDQPGPYQPGPYQSGGQQSGPYQQPGPFPAGQGWAQTRPGPRTADGVPLAGWWWRFLAAFIDLMITGIVSSVAALPIYLKLVPAIAAYVNSSVAAAERGQTAPAFDAAALISDSDRIWLTIISVAVGMLYFSLFWRLRGATLGQTICGLRVVPAGDGRHTGGLPWAQSIVRAVVWSVPMTVGGYLLLFAVLNVLFPLWNADRQAIHDLAARTQLVTGR